MEPRDSKTMDQTVAEGSEGTLWSRILASTDRRSARGSGASDRAGTGKRIVVLGSHDSGKSTVIRALARPDSSNRSSYDNSRKDKGKAVAIPEQDRPDLGINFQYIDIADDGDSGEDSSSRLSVYQVPPMSHSLHSTLMPLALTRESLLDSLVLIMLDWEKPWTFLRDLKIWLEALNKVVDGIEREGERDATQDSRRRKGKHVVEEGRELLEAYVRNYHEPSQRDATPATASTVFPLAASSDNPSPLPAGTLEVNLGCNIVVVCNKSDCIQALERDAQLNEESVEYIQQTLRTICLQYGAALSFTSQYHPTTVTRLRSYVLHRLHAGSSWSSQAPTQSDTSHDGAAAAGLTTSSRYPFPYRANAVDREQICIPSGWDSFGKIRVLREGFDCTAVARGWQLDLGASIQEEDGKRTPSTLSTYESIVADVETLRNPYATSGGYLEVQNEQDFLRAHHEMLARETAKARQQQQQLAASSGKPIPGVQSPDIADVAKKFFGSAGIVGPMTSAGLSLPTVERALERENAAASTDAGIAKKPGPERRESARPSSSLANGHVPSLPLPHQPTSPPLPSSPTPSAGGGTQNEVLANFFQSLLADRKDKAGKGSSGPAARGTASNRNSVDLSKSAGRRTE